MPLAPGPLAHPSPTVGPRRMLLTQWLCSAAEGLHAQETTPCAEGPECAWPSSCREAPSWLDRTGQTPALSSSPQRGTLHLPRLFAKQYPRRQSLQQRPQGRCSPDQQKCKRPLENCLETLTIHRQRVLPYPWGSTAWSRQGYSSRESP